MRPPTRSTVRIALILGLLGMACRPSVCQEPVGATPSPVLTLDQAIQSALADNGPLNAGGRDVRKAQDAAAAARAELLPTLKLYADAGTLLDPVNVRVPAGSLGTVNSTPFPETNSLVYSAHGAIGDLQASLAQPLTQLPRIRLNIRLQQIGTQSAVEQQRGRDLAVVAGVKQTYYAILGTQDSITAAEQTLAYDQELERTVGDFVAHKTALQADLLDAQTQTDAQELALTKLQDTLTDEEEQMNVQLNRDIATPFRVEMPPDELASSADIAGLRAQALDQRPDLRVAALGVQQAALGRRIQQQAAVPDVSLVLSYDRLPGGATGLPNHVAEVGLRLDWAPLDWGRQRDALDGARQQYEQAQASLADAQTQALLAVGMQARQLQEAQGQLAVAQAGQHAAQERLREMLNQYQQKAILLKDVLQQQAAAATADQQVQQAMLQILAARSALDTAVGNGP